MPAKPSSANAQPEWVWGIVQWRSRDPGLLRMPGKKAGRQDELAGFSGGEVRAALSSAAGAVLFAGGREGWRLEAGSRRSRSGSRTGRRRGGSTRAK